MNQPNLAASPESFGRYLLYPAIARGGMATVHPARLVGAEGFTRLVAAKRLHPQFLDDPDFVTMFHDEACIASRIHHPNVVPVLDVVVADNELILVQEYVHGVPLSQLMKIAVSDASPIPVDVVIAVVTGVLAGLHAAHEVTDETGASLEIVHRDVSPANVMVSVDGIVRLLDFGIAKARTSTTHTREGVFKGKLAYMAPEQLRMEHIDRTIDVYAAGVLAWELLVNRRVYDGRQDVHFVSTVMKGEVPTITQALSESRASIDDERWRDLVAIAPIVSRAMAPRREDRFATAADMLRALVDVHASATSMDVTTWVRSAGADYLGESQKTLAANEESWRRTALYTPTPGSGSLRVALAPPTSSSFAVAVPAIPVAQETPSVVNIVGARTSAPPSTRFMSAGPSSMSPIVSSSERDDLDPSFRFPVAARLRSSRLLPWAAAATLLVTLGLGGLLRAATETAPAVSTTSAISDRQGVTEKIATPPPRAAAIAPRPESEMFVAMPVAPTLPPRPVHVAPPPPPSPRFVPVSRPAPPPHPPSQSGANGQDSQSSSSTGNASSSPSSARGDCNPPFFFEGTKKVFKPSCL